MQVSFQKCLLEILGLVIFKCKTILCKEVGQNINKKLPENVKKMKILSFFHYLCLSEEISNQTLGIFLKKNVLQT